MNWPGKFCFSIQRTKVHWSHEKLELQSKMSGGKKKTYKNQVNELLSFLLLMYHLAQASYNFTLSSYVLYCSPMAVPWLA